jgi:hypothetical protein
MGAASKDQSSSRRIDSFHLRQAPVPALSGRRATGSFRYSLVHERLHESQEAVAGGTLKHRNLHPQPGSCLQPIANGTMFFVPK